jgi:hypothetical protein
MFLFIGCSNPDPNLIYHGNDWVVKRLNDTVVICIPTQGDLLGRQPNKPYVINIKDFSESKFK